MKTLIAVWILALVTGAGTVRYIDSSINLLVKSGPSVALEASVLQGGDVGVESLQPSVVLSHVRVVQDTDEDLQPALGYQVLTSSVGQL